MVGIDLRHLIVRIVKTIDHFLNFIQDTYPGIIEFPPMISLHNSSGVREKSIIELSPLIGVQILNPRAYTYRTTRQTKITLNRPITHISATIKSESRSGNKAAACSSPCARCEYKE